MIRPTHPVHAFATASRTVEPRPTIGVIHSAPQQMARSTMRTVRLTVAPLLVDPGVLVTSSDPPSTDSASTSPWTVRRSAWALTIAIRLRRSDGIQRSCERARFSSSR